MNDYMTPMDPNAYVGYGEEAFTDAMAGSLLGIFVVVYMLVLFLGLAFSIASYVLTSLGMYTIAERRGIRHGWLAWIPFGSLWMLGSISDQYQYVAKGKVKNRRKLLLGLSIGTVAIYVVWVFAMVIGVIMSETAGSGAAMAVLLMFVGLFGFFALAITMSVFQYICFYDLFYSCQPNNAVLYLVLSIAFSVTLPFFVFACRKKDLGMPPRKQEPVQEIAQPVQTVEAAVEEVPEEIVSEPVEGFAQPEEFVEE